MATRKGTTGAWDNDETLLGTVKSDTIEGGTGADILIGLGGDDTFVFNVGDSGIQYRTGVLPIHQHSDQILDFNRGDSLDLTDLVSAGYSISFSAIGLDDARVLAFKHGEAVESITLWNVNHALLSIDDGIVTLSDPMTLV